MNRRSLNVFPGNAGTSPCGRRLPRCLAAFGTCPQDTARPAGACAQHSAPGAPHSPPAPARRRPAVGHAEGEVGVWVGWRPGPVKTMAAQRGAARFWESRVMRRQTIVFRRETRVARWELCVGRWRAGLGRREPCVGGWPTGVWRREAGACRRGVVRGPRNQAFCAGKRVFCAEKHPRAGGKHFIPVSHACFPPGNTRETAQDGKFPAPDTRAAPAREKPPPPHAEPAVGTSRFPPASARFPPGRGRGAV